MCIVIAGYMLYAVLVVSTHAYRVSTRLNALEPYISLVLLKLIHPCRQIQREVVAQKFHNIQLGEL